MSIRQFFKAILVSNYGADVYAKVFHFFFCPCATIETKVFNLGLCFLCISAVYTCMDGGPSEHRFHRSFFAMNKNTLAGRDLVIDATVSFEVNKTFIIDVIHKPADLISMS